MLRAMLCTRHCRPALGRSFSSSPCRAKLVRGARARPAARPAVRPVANGGAAKGAGAGAGAGADARAGAHSNTGKLSPIDLLHPARQYPKARRIKRRVHLHIGPTNSGKSYNALLAFKSAGSGYYAGPLRMLAREIYDRMEAEGVPCNLVTGDEILEKPGATLNSGTVEMVDLGHDMDLAVIDEIQMIEDPARGWAWTRAFLGLRARTIHLCGDPSSEHIVTQMVAECGDDLEVHRYERLSPLRVLQAPLQTAPKNASRHKAKAKAATGGLPSLYSSVEPGDCVVCFSKRQVQTVRDRICQAHGNKMCCAIIYGSLPPETRAEQARLFNGGGNQVDFLVASDAIGMGLNLGIKRIIFTTLNKFDGRKLRKLAVSEIKQIAGRAGRFRTADGAKGEDGTVACLRAEDAQLVHEAMQTPTPVIKRAVLMPPPQMVRSAMIGSLARERGVTFSTALEDVLKRSRTSAHYRHQREPGSRGPTGVSDLFDHVRNLTFDDRMVLANAPVPSGLQVVRAAFTEMCRVIGNGESRNALEMFPEMMSWLEEGKAVGQTLEAIHKTLTLFLWVSYRFPCNFADRQGAVDLKRLCEHQFNALLANSKRHLAAPGRALTMQTNAITNRIAAAGSPLSHELLRAAPEPAAGRRPRRKAHAHTQ